MAKQGLDVIRTTKLATMTSVLDTYLVPVYTSTNAKPQLATVANFNAGGVIDSNNVWTGTNGFDDTVSIGKSGTAGDIKIYPSTASKGYVTITCDDQTGNTAVEINVNAMGQETVVNLDDPGIAASHLLQSTAQITVAEADILDGATVNTAELNILDGATLTVAELNKLDDSTQTETITVAGAIDPNITNTNLDSTAGTFAATLAACPATMIGKIKTIRFAVDNGDVTLALTEIQGGTAATTATFADATDELILIGSAGGKWTVIKEFGVTLS